MVMTFAAAQPQVLALAESVRVTASVDVMIIVCTRLEHVIETHARAERTAAAAAAVGHAATVTRCFALLLLRHHHFDSAHFLRDGAQSFLGCLVTAHPPRVFEDA